MTQLDLFGQVPILFLNPKLGPFARQGWRATYVLAGAPGLLLALLLSLAEEPRNNNLRFSFNVDFHFQFAFCSFL